MDFSAWDTVTNLALTKDLIVRQIGATNLHVVTETFHLPRAMIIARGVYLFEEMNVIAEEYTGGDQTRVEGWYNTQFDRIRALTFRFSGILFYDRAVLTQRIGWFKEDY